MYLKTVQHILQATNDYLDIVKISHDLNQTWALHAKCLGSDILNLHTISIGHHESNGGDEDV